MKAVKAWAVVAVLILSGCAESVGQHELVWDKRGCAFLVHAGLGEVRYLYRFPQSDKPPCTITAEEPPHE